MQEFLNGILTRLQNEFDPEIVGGSLVELVANIIVGVLTFMAFYALWWVLDFAVRFFVKRTDVDETTISFIETVLKYVLLTIGTIQALSAVGINTAAMLTSLGIAGLTIGFAARDALSNLISGILIFWDRPFVIGDLVEVGGQYGRVDKITLRSTRIVTVDGRMLAVPNTTIINTTVASYTNFPNIRLEIDVTVAVTEDIDRIRHILQELVRSDRDFMENPPPAVVVKSLNDYNVALQLRVWLGDERKHISKSLELRERVFKTLTAAGVEMPYETIQLAPFETKALVERRNSVN